MLVAICDDTQSDAEKIRFSLMDIADAAKLFGKQFIEVRRGVLVNPEYIERISGTDVILSDGSIYKLPKAKKTVLLQFMLNL